MGNIMAIKQPAQRTPRVPDVLRDAVPVPEPERSTGTHRAAVGIHSQQAGTTQRAARVEDAQGGPGGGGEGMKREPKPWAYDLWVHMLDQHGLILLDSELAEIIRLAVRVEVEDRKRARRKW